MRRICLSHPFVHGTTGCWGRSKIVPNFWEQKIPAAFSILLYHHFQLQSECLGGLVLDQFDAPNPPVVSICPWDDWLLRYKQNRAQFLRAKNSGSFFHPPLPPLSTTIRRLWRVVSGPIWCAESSYNMHFHRGPFGCRGIAKTFWGENLPDGGWWYCIVCVELWIKLIKYWQLP